jgi:hypothetical protein
MKIFTKAAADFIMRHDRVLALDLLVVESVLERRERELSKQWFRFRSLRAIKRKTAPGNFAYLMSDEDASIELIVELLLCKILDNFSSYLIDLAELVLSNNPRDFREILKIDINETPGSHEDNHDHRTAIEAKIDQLSFYGFGKLSEFFTKSFRLKLIELETDYWFLVKMFELRNCTVHYDGIISEISARRCPDLALSVGKRINIPHDQLTDYRRKIEVIFFDIDNRFREHFKLPNHAQPRQQ